jgi:hypothetical protein
MSRLSLRIVCLVLALAFDGAHGLSAQTKSDPTDQAPRLKRPATLTQSELNTLMGRIRACWAPPVALLELRDLVVTLQIDLKPDGSLAREPTVVNRDPRPAFQAAAQSAVRAVHKCLPFDFLPAAKYDLWKSMEINFDPGTAPR